MTTTDRINVIITRIISPTNFWLKLQSNNCINVPNPSQTQTGIDEQNTCKPGIKLSWVKGICQHIFLNI